MAAVLLYGFAAIHEGVDFFWVKYLILDLTFTHQLYTFFPAALYEMPLDGTGNQFWSISVEEQFYLIAPLIIIFTSLGNSIKCWSIIAVFMVLLDWNFAAISLGVCTAILQRDFNFASRLSVRVGAIATALVCAIGMSVFDTKFVFQPLLAVSVVIAVAIPGARSSLAMTFGGLSYPLYLNAWIGGFAVNFFTKRWLPIDATTFMITQYVLNVMLAFAMYWVIDREIQKRRNAWFSPLVGRILALTAYGLVGTGIIVGAAMHVFGPHADIPTASYRSDK